MKNISWLRDKWPRICGYARDAFGALRWPVFAIRYAPLARIVAQVKRDRLTYLSRSALADLALAIRHAPDEPIIEAGAALGGSTIVLAAAKRPSQPLYVYDTFGMIPPPSPKDGLDAHQRYQTIADGNSKGLANNVYYGYRGELKAEVSDNLCKYGFQLEENQITLIQGYFEDTLHVDHPVAVAHVDCDWYQSVRTCLERIAPHVVPGGRIVVDDYDHWSGARRAVDEWLQQTHAFSAQARSRLHLARKAPSTRKPT